MPALKLQKIRKAAAAWSNDIFNDRLWTVELPRLHYAVGLIFGAMGIFVHLYDMGYNIYTQPVQGYDFIAYYGAARVLHHFPQGLYDLKYFSVPYVPPVAVMRLGVFTFLNPPTFAMLLYPLGFFGYCTAYVLWTLVNLALSFFIWKRIGLLADVVRLQKFKPLLMSMAVGTFAWSNTLLNGQAAILLCFLLLSFLLDWDKKAYTPAAFWLAAAMCIKPHLFAPLLLFLFAYRQYPLVLRCVLMSAAMVVASVLVVGVQCWVEYIQHLAVVNQSIKGYNAGFDGMISLRGAISSLLPVSAYPRYYPLLMQASRVWFILALVASYAVGWLTLKRRLPVQVSVALVIMMGWVFGPWLHMYDFYLVLPVAVLIAAEMLHAGQGGWLVSPYLLVATGFPSRIAYRIIMLVLLGFAGFRFRQGVRK